MLFFQFMHTPFVRALRVVLGFYMIGSAIMAHFLIAMPMVLLGAVIAASGVADMRIIETMPEEAPQTDLVSGQAHALGAH
jgi:hypothetical protein